MPRRPAIMLLAFALLFLSLPAPAQAGGRVALVVGNGKYDASPLRNPVNDARDVAAALKSLGFDVILRPDATRGQMIDALESFGAKLRRAEAGVFYFAGHGMQIRGQNYLIPVGVRVSRESDVEYEAVAAGRVLGVMEDAGCPVSVVILDACRDNPFARSFRSSSRGLAVLQAARGAFISYATSPGDVAADGSGQNGVFTKHLLQHLRTPGLSIEQVFKRVAAGVYSETGQHQMPWVSSSLMGDFSFAGGGSAAPVPFAPAPQQVVMAPAPSAPLAPESFIPKPTSHKQGDTWTEPATGMEFVWVPGGCFQMGSNTGADDEKPVHEVCVDGFWMGKYEVTRGQFRSFVRQSGYRTEAEMEGWSIVGVGGKRKKASSVHWDKTNFEQNERHPVVHVTWNDATAMAKWLSGKGSKIFRLPTEAEWEYAAGAKTTTARYWGDDPDKACKYANVYDMTSGRVNRFDIFPHQCEDGHVATAPVGSFLPNAFGLFDVMGNVREWCEDKFDKNSYFQHSRSNPVSSGSAGEHILRGGCWYDSPEVMYTAMRLRYDSSVRSDGLGFRLIRLLQE